IYLTGTVQSYLAAPELAISVFSSQVPGQETENNLSAKRHCNVKKKKKIPCTCIRVRWGIRCRGCKFLYVYNDNLQKWMRLFRGEEAEKKGRGKGTIELADLNIRT
ncbi:hypothetical protein P3445_23625, partial [Vibrio parahaemolyticus]|nr:hypothetical protein [Vibrio parahaemolyticus]